MNMSKSRDIQAKMPSPKVIYASNESKSVLARNLEECRDNDKNSQSVFLSFKCIFARNCEGTEQLRAKMHGIVELFLVKYFIKRKCVTNEATRNNTNAILLVTEGGYFQNGKLFCMQ